MRSWCGSTMCQGQYGGHLSSIMENTAPEALASQCLQNQIAYLAFIDRHVFSYARSHPWSLVEGNIEDNLEELSGMETEPRDPTTRKI